MKTRAVIAGLLWTVGIGYVVALLLWGWVALIALFSTVVAAVVLAAIISLVVATYDYIRADQ